MDYGSSDTSTTSLGANQFPISETWTPNAGFSALEGGPQSTDLGGKKSAPASMYVKDGGDVAQGTTTDAANASTVVGQLKQIQANTSGNATAANQTTANASLSSVATNTSNTATNTSNINVATGAKADSAATDSTSSWSVIALLKGIYAKLAGTLGISGTVTANAGTGTFTNQQSNIQTDYDTGAGTQNMTMYGVALPASGGSVAGGTSSNPLRTDPTGTTTQPVSGTVTANAGTGNMGSNLTQVAGNTIAVGNNAVPVLNSAATGYVAAFGSNAAALTSATDYSFKWGAGGTTQVNHILLQNNTASSLNWDLDVAATGGSPTLAAGQTLFLDVQTSTLHLFQAGTSSVNGTASGNIVIRAWI